MKKETTMKILVTLSYLFMITVNALANILPLNGLNTGEISDSYPNLFAPAGFTFSIWGIIYLLLGLFVIYQWKKTSSFSRFSHKDLLSKLRVPFIVTSLLNSLWLFSWHYQQIGLSTVFMLGLLITLIYADSLFEKVRLSKKEIAFLHVPFSVYFGWITVATVANITITLVKFDWDGFGLAPEIWTILVLIITCVIASIVIYTKTDFAYGAVIVWAYIGIAAKHLQSDGWDGNYPFVLAAIYATLGVILIVSTSAFQHWRRRPQHLREF